MKQAIDSEIKKIEPGTIQDVFPLMGDLAFQVVAQALFSRSDIQKDMERLQDFTERQPKDVNQRNEATLPKMVF